MSSSDSEPDNLWDYLEHKNSYYYKSIEKNLRKNNEALLNEALNEDSASVKLIRSFNNETLLHLSTRFSRMEAVKRLIEHGIDINSRDNFDETPLFEATRSKSAEIFKFLLSNGADINITKKKGPNFLQAALLWSPIETVEIIIQKLHLGCENQDTFQAIDDIQKCHKIVMLLLGYDFDINAVSPYDKNCILHHAILLNKISQVHLLLAYGANVEAEDNCGFTPLARACQKGRMDILKLLVNYGANFHGKNKCTMLHHAVVGGNIEIIDLLIRMGFNINAENDNGEPPLCHATNVNAKVDAVPLVEFLIDNGANFDLYSLLDYDTKHPDVVECLLEWSGSFKDKASRGSATLQFFLNCTRKITVNTELLIAFMTTTQIDINALKKCYFLDFNRVRVNQFYENCKLEILKMKNVKFKEDKLISLYDFLTSDLMKVTNYAEVEEIVKNLESSDLVLEYPHYAFLLEKRIGRVKTILYFKDSIANFLEKYAKLKLPTNIVDHIFGHLRVGHIRNFARALSLTKKESKTGTLPLPGYLTAQCVNPWTFYESIIMKRNEQ